MNIVRKLSSWRPRLKRNSPEDPSVTVIIPFLNAANHLPKSIESVVRQDYANWELVLVDDGSSDESLAIAQRYAHQHQNIRLIEGQSSAGPATLRNLAIEMTDSEYVAFLDADDVMSADSLAARARVLESDGLAAAAYSPVVLVDESGDSLGLSGTAKDIVSFTDLSGNLFITSCIMVRRSIISALGGFDTTLRHGEDWDMWLRITRMGHYIKRASGSKIEYRQHAASLSHSAPHRDFLLRRRVAGIAWSRDDRCTDALPEFKEGLGPAIQAMQDAHRAFSTYVSCLFLGQTSDGDKLLSEVNMQLLSLSDPKEIAQASKFSIMRNAAISKNAWDAYKREQQERVTDKLREQLPDSIEIFTQAYVSNLFA